MILTSGCFDGLHDGHRAFLRALAQLGPFVVAVAPDAYIRKHKDRNPTQPLAQRMAALREMPGVARVLAHGLYGAEDVLQREPWRGFAKGMDWYGQLPKDILQICQARQIPIVFVESGSDQHSRS